LPTFLVRHHATAELAVRTALGASRSRIVGTCWAKQRFSASLAVAGLLFSRLLVAALLAIGQPTCRVAGIGIEVVGCRLPRCWRRLAPASSIGLAPAVQAWRGDLRRAPGWRAWSASARPSCRSVLCSESRCDGIADDGRGPARSFQQVQAVDQASVLRTF
jgi:hypothetical protein